MADVEDAKEKAPARRNTRVAAVARLVKRKAKKKIRQSRDVLRYLTKINDLKSEIELLTTYSSDTIYRLRYDTMQYDYISPSVKKLLGYTPESMRVVNFRSLVLETKIVTDGLRTVDSYDGLEASRKKGDVHKWQADYLIKTKDDRQLWVSDISYPWFDKKGNIIGSIGCLRDISDRVAAEEFAREELVRLANTDQLTGLANRRAFFNKVDDEIKRSRRSKSDFSILLVDIDHFKRINDAHGHDAGDVVINEVGKLIKSCLRETDLPARLGGEEFGSFLPDTPIEGAYWVAERIRTTIARHKFVLPDGEIIHATVSIGLSESAFATSEVTSTGMFKIADTRLYIAKNTGRNQVSMDELVHLH